MIYLPSFLLSIILTCTVLSVYGTLLPLKMLLAVIIISLISYTVLIYTDRHRLSGSLFTTIFIAITLILTGTIASAGMIKTDVFFWQWVLTSGDEASSNLYYIFALTLGAGVFFTITVYYFSVVLYRISFLTLISLIPCVLYAKVMADINNFYLILIAGSLMILHICRGRHEKEYIERNSHAFSLNLSFSRTEPEIPITAGSFILFVLLICALIPKEKEAKYYDRFEDLFLGGDTTSELSQDFSSMSYFSANGDNYSSLTNRRLYTLYGDSYAYLKRQNYDYYDPATDHWYYDDDALKTVYSPESFKRKSKAMNIRTLQAAVKTACENIPGFTEKYDLDLFLKQPPLEDPERSLFIRSENFQAVYYLSSSRAIEVIPSSPGSGHGITSSGIFIRNDGTHDPDFSYRLKFYDQSTAIDSWVKTGITSLSQNECLHMLTEMADFYAKNDLPEYKKEKESVDSFLSEQVYAKEYKEQTGLKNAEIPYEIKSLAKKLTKDYKNDYYKAAAIVRYFHNGDFTYDSEYIPEDPGVSAFLFENKRGSCSDFATAFVLLARSAGLTARYAEGFLPEITTRENYYTISERNSHAFPEVFIANTGWIVYEPTIGGTASQFDARRHGIWGFIESLRIDLRLAFFVALFIAVLFFIIVLVKLLIPKTLETIFRISLIFMSTDHVIRRTYERLRKKYKTPALTPSEFNLFLRERGRGIPLISSSYEALVYGGLLPETGKRLKFRFIKEYLKN